MKVVVFSGAGISAESGIPTFRDKIEGIWENVNPYDVAHINTWHKEPEKVIEFHDVVRNLYGECEPNDAHKFFAELEEKHDVTVITQNIDNLHEKAGSSNVLHLHGELDKVKCQETNDIYHYKDDKVVNSDGDGSQFKPYTVLFGEYPHNVNDSIKALEEAEMLIIVGTSFDISYILPMLVEGVRKNVPVYYIDRDCSYNLNGHFKNLTIIKDTAINGIKKLEV